jgi:pimeloyl-ACP methyl ester carboxylesterase
MQPGTVTDRAVVYGGGSSFESWGGPPLSATLFLSRRFANRCRVIVLDLRGNCQALPFDAPLPDSLPVETIFLHPPITKDLKSLIVALELLTAVS